MAPKESKICKQEVAGTSRPRTLTTAGTLEIIKKSGSATSHSDITVPYKIGL